MISRRDALRLGAAGLMATSLGAPGSPVVSQQSSVAEQPENSVPVYRGNAARTGVMPGPVPSFDLPIVIRWRYYIGSRFVPPEIMVENGMAVIHAGDELVHALDAETGATLWQFDSGHSMGTVSVSRGVVYVGGNTQLWALDAASGSVLWNHVSDGHGLNDPIEMDGTVLVRGNDGHFRALDARTGAERWRAFSDENFGSPAVANGIAFLSSDSHLFAINITTGNERWRFPAESDRGIPVVDDDLVFMRSKDGHLYAIDVATGAERWRYATPPSPREFCVADGTVFLGSNPSGLFAVDAATGVERWQFRTGAFSGPTLVVGDVVFVAAGPSVYAIDTRTGEELRRIQAGDYSFNEPTVIDGVVYVATQDGYAYALINLAPPVLLVDTDLRAAPSSMGVERGSASAGDQVDQVGGRHERDGERWIEVTINDVTGWIPLDVIDPATMPPDGEIDYVYVPEA